MHPTAIEADQARTPQAAPLLPVWDLPTRLFHWTLVALIAFSWWTAEEGELELHMWSGFAILTLLLFRLLWGFFGGSTARFRNFVRGPAAVLGYLRDTKGWRAAGHTPLGALSVVALLGAIAIQVGLGLVSVDEDGLNEGPLAYLVSLDLSEQLRDLHEDFFNVLLALIGLHVAAVLFYRLVMGKKLTAPMIVGRGVLEPGVEPMRPAGGWVAIVCLLVALGVTRWIVAGAPLGT
ncbi:cytochrome b/b6 domain-containing protein [Sphingomonas sp.]|uniref:cytochrome b/b6 domain-containing protein n=1 Tax=Sphingomonas sp. TaxID=28214 RepID=UPI0025FABE2F|nr:cytochrome b/b6 domain-containing protein [Sphingomonas sp.]